MLTVDKKKKDMTLKRIIEQYAEDSITDEQVARVLAPVLARIHAGEFDRRKRKQKVNEK